MSIPHNCIGSPCLICQPNQRIFGTTPEPVIDCNLSRLREETVPASHQCMECKGPGSIILGRADSQVRSRGVVQCAECRFWFHTDCIIRHFETAAAKRIVDLEATIKAKDNVMERLAGEMAKLEAENAALLDRVSALEPFASHRILDGKCSVHGVRCEQPTIEDQERAAKAWNGGKP